VLPPSMLHTRPHKIEDFADADDLAHKLSTQVHALDAGFRFGGYLWLNDSTSEDALQEYAIVRERDGLQVESYTVWTLALARSSETVGAQALARMIVDAAEGRFDNSPMAECRVFVAIETSELRLAKAIAGSSPEDFKRQVDQIHADLVERGYIEPRLPATPAVVKELFIDGKRIDLDGDQVAKPVSFAGFTVIVRAEDVHWTIGGRELNRPAGHRSDRENRTENALAELSRHLDPSAVLVDDRGLWAKAVEWYENRPIGGTTDGETLYACAAMFLPGAKACRWANVLDHERFAFERAAAKLQRHGAP
jgi:hypothetical protein